MGFPSKFKAKILKSTNLIEFIMFFIRQNFLMFQDCSKLPRIDPLIINNNTTYSIILLNPYNLSPLQIFNYNNHCNFHFLYYEINFNY